MRAIVFQDFEIIAEGESIGEIVDEMYIRVGKQLYNLANVVRDTPEARANLYTLRRKYNKLQGTLAKLNIISAGNFRRAYAIPQKEK